MMERTELEYGMSVEDYVKGFGDVGFEIIDGEVVFMSPNLPGHGFLIRDLAFAMQVFLVNNSDWEVISEQAFAMMDATRSNWVKGLLAPDIMLMRKAEVQAFKKAKGKWQVTPFTIIPPLVVEVVSDSDTIRMIMRKIKQYFEIGIETVWLIDPFDRNVRIYKAGGNLDYPDVLHEPATLTDDRLPGFSYPLADLFAD